MKLGFYPRLASDGIRKNRRMYLPYLMTTTAMVAMHYIIGYLTVGGALENVPGTAFITSLLYTGGWVVAVFSVIFLFYTNSFLIRRRKREFGLYNILGMGKWNIGRILLWESLITALISLTAGLLIGALLSKAAELMLINLINGEVNYVLRVSPAAAVVTISVYSGIFLLLLLNSLWQIRSSTAISLLRSENYGERPPRANWLVGVLGVLILGAAYYIAVTIRDPLTAVGAFFIAVVMVIVGTYMVMISGSVLFCRILQRNKRYYYNPRHFVSVSSMVYRMKRNGAGLASICILSTMVLVMISSTTSLYFGQRSALRERYPRELNLQFYMKDASYLSDENVSSLLWEVEAVNTAQGITAQNVYGYRAASVSGLLEDGEVELDSSALSGFNLSTFSSVYRFIFMPIEDFNGVAGTDYTVGPGEAVACVFRSEIDCDTISFTDDVSYRIVAKPDTFIPNPGSSMEMIPTIILAVSDLDSLGELRDMRDYNGFPILQYTWNYNYDTGADAEAQTRLYDALRDKFTSNPTLSEFFGFTGRSIECREVESQDFLSLYGGLFYVGIVLSIVFSCAAVLIIYYKQISEGYEDESRFEIMKKVGMTDREIRRSINSQLLTVFYLPLIFAAMHLIFAFPLIKKLLSLLQMINNLQLFAITTGLSLGIFALLYMLVYRATSNAYYRIVRGAR